MEKQITELAVVTKKATINIEQMQDSTMKAVQALSKITEITTDDQDEYAAKLLGKVKSTYDKVSKLRLEITSPMDGIKKELISYENKISPKKGSGSAYDVVKRLRDNYAQLKQKQADEERRKIEAEHKKNEELSRVRGEMIRAVEMGIVDLLASGDSNLIKFKARLTLENWKEKTDKLKYTPKLPDSFWKTLLKVEIGSLSMEEFNQIADKVKEEKKLESENSYVVEAGNRLAKFKEDLKSYKKELKAGAKIDAEKELQKAERKAAAEKEAKSEELKEQVDEEKIQNTFEAQIKSQAVEDVSGVRRSKYIRFDKKVEGDPLKLAETLLNVVINCLSNPEFKGIYKLDNKGNQKLDEKGNPIYCDGVDFWLKNLSKSKDFSINGINVEELVSTVTKS